MARNSSSQTTFDLRAKSPWRNEKKRWDQRRNGGGNRLWGLWRPSRELCVLLWERGEALSYFEYIINCIPDGDNSSQGYKAGKRECWWERPVVILHWMGQERTKTQEGGRMNIWRYIVPGRKTARRKALICEYGLLIQ